MFRFGLPRLDFRPSLGSGLVSPRIKKSAGSFPKQRLEIEPMYLPLLETRKGDWSRNASRNCFWDCYQGCPVSYWLIVSLSFITVPEVFVKVNLTHFPIRF